MPRRGSGADVRCPFSRKVRLAWPPDPVWRPHTVRCRFGGCAMAVYGTLEGGREVLLTFDDGPHPKWTPILLDYLKEAEVKAMFFVLGQCVGTGKNLEIVT